jgi:uroporphyrinogen-III decarboxylase
MPDINVLGPACHRLLHVNHIYLLLLSCCGAGTGKLDVVAGSNADVIGLDWSTSMRVCRQTLGPQHKVQGNVDPMVLFGTQVGCKHSALT